VLAVDERGLAVPPPPDVAGLARVRDSSGVLRAPGDHIDPGLVSAALAYAARFGELTYRADTGYIATSPEGWEVRLGTDAAAASRQLDLLAALRRDLAGQASAVAFVDLRFTNRPFYRLRGESE
jgi:hypothetical protein